MKQSLHSKPQPAGVALVIVLGFLVLISAIIIGFFASVSTELASSKATANSASTHQLADSAINVVMAQIVDATKGQDSSSSTLAWASQPGMIRTFDNTGKAKDLFKLYSSDQMTVPGTGFVTTDEVPPADWSKADNAALYTDLNEPALTLDPTGLIQPDSTKSDKYSAVYPIMDPFAEGMVDGFKLTSRPGYPDPSLPKPEYNPAKVTTKDKSPNPAPMPVKWLYVLKDGAMKPASNATNGNVTVQGASDANPIVGRIAFWADDETAKVNINTASEGTYWDVPRIYSKQDFGEYASNTNGFSRCQPVQHEYQRYPGHPATTCLSPIFGSLLPLTSPYPTNPQSADSDKLDPYYSIVPRIGLSGGGGGGSKGGSFETSSTAGVMATDSDRLYASVDELMFTPGLAGVSRIPNTSTAAAPKKITKGILEKTKFFLTANSTAPETTLNNTPRVAVWPISNTRTAYDSLLAFCSTIGNQPYYFTRSNARSGTADYAPGSRNESLYKYLQKLTGIKIPGFGGDFLTKYPAGSLPGGASDRDQILTYIFDYIRSTNLQDRSSGATSFTPVFDASNPIAGAGEVIPIRIGQTQGFGRFYSITSANLLFYGTHATSGKVDKMRAVFFFAFTTPMQGLACMRSKLKYKVTQGLDGFKANGNSLSFKPGGTNFIDMTDLAMFHGRGVGGTESPWMAMRYKPFNDADAGGDADNKYPFFSFQDVAVSGTDFAFASDKEIVVEIRAADTDQVVQTVHFSFPKGQFSVPTGVDNANFGSRTGGEYTNLVKVVDTVVSVQVAGANGNDSAKADDPTAGDIRMIASLIDVPSSRYRADNNYMTPKIQKAHCLVQSTGTNFDGAIYGRLANVPDPAYKQPNHDRHPDVPSRVSKGVQRKDTGPGDWDTGFGDQKDGAYINKPDEGDTAFGGSTGGHTRLPYMLGYGQGFASATNTFFSPNRQIPSPLMFGSIPTGVQRMLPWQTLLFHPRPEDTSHPGNQSPKDHLIADLFWMPVVEPYAISQPFATNGKINLNYQIMPFTYISRSTGMQAVMKSTRCAALALSDSQVYKPLDATGGGMPPTAPDRRQPIDLTATLKAFDTKFAKTDNSENIFRSASQICEMNLVPPGETDSSMAAFWKTKFAFTGDNLREKPYVDLYSRLTTKSNTYTVHVRVQALKKAPGTQADQWVGAKDRVVGEYRGSSILERYIDVNDPGLPDFATKFAANPTDSTLNIDQYYKMRVVSTKRFAP